jgi:hypothetical protein
VHIENPNICTLNLMREWKLLVNYFNIPIRDYFSSNKVKEGLILVGVFLEGATFTC